MNKAKKNLQSPPSPNLKTSLKRRLSMARGHLEGVERMVEAGEVSHVDLMRQIKAVIGALDKVSLQAFEDSVRQILVTKMGEGDAQKSATGILESLKYR